VGVYLLSVIGAFTATGYGVIYNYTNFYLYIIDSAYSPLPDPSALSGISVDNVECYSGETTTYSI
jgi:hypothetical protein